MRRGESEKAEKKAKKTSGDAALKFPYFLAVTSWIITASLGGLVNSLAVKTDYIVF